MINEKYRNVKELLREVALRDLLLTPPANSGGIFEKRPSIFFKRFSRKGAKTPSIVT
jgi:hypothetical protein